MKASPLLPWLGSEEKSGMLAQILQMFFVSLLREFVFRIQEFWFEKSG